MGFTIPILAFLLTAAASSFAASETGPELHISGTGDVHIVGGEVVTKHAMNLISVNVWGQRWTIPMDERTIVESADGIRLAMQDIDVGQKIELTGRPVPTRAGVPPALDARTLRILSIKKSVAPVKSSPPKAKPSPVKTSTAKPVSMAPRTAKSETKSIAEKPQPIFENRIAPAPPEGLLRQYLVPGMRSPEVTLVQEFLQKNGWVHLPDGGRATGYYGAMTAEAVVRFQAAHRLPAEGTVGPKTRALINSFLQKISPRAKLRSA